MDEIKPGNLRPETNLLQKVAHHNNAHQPCPSQHQRSLFGKRTLINTVESKACTNDEMFVDVFSGKKCRKFKRWKNMTKIPTHTFFLEKIDLHFATSTVSLVF